MKVLVAVQRYGPEVAGGAEAHAREYALRLAARGHAVEVLTSCARDETTWSDHFAAGSDVVEDILVHRLPVRRPRDPARFGSLAAAAEGRRGTPYWLQAEWMRQQGPWMPELAGWMADRSHSFDVAVFIGGSYWLAWSGLGRCEPQASSSRSLTTTGLRGWLSTRVYTGAPTRSASRPRRRPSWCSRW